MNENVRLIYQMLAGDTEKKENPKKDRMFHCHVLSKGLIRKIGNMVRLSITNKHQLIEMVTF